MNTTPQRGDHVTVGNAKTVWIVDYVAHKTVMVDRVNRSTGQYTRRGFPLGRVKVVGQHALRDSPRETPQNCRDCGCFREVRS